jgi:hypothetical protein
VLAPFGILNRELHCRSRITIPTIPTSIANAEIVLGVLVVTF